MANMTMQRTPIDGVVKVERISHTDGRGSFERLFDSQVFRESLPEKDIQQINLSFTQEKGSIRGMHCQRPPFQESKLVSCLRGTIFDVAVDLRAESPTFLGWHSEMLSAENRIALLIPEGVAHGFQTLTHNCELLYAHTGTYQPDYEFNLNPLDPRLCIGWPLIPTCISVKDKERAFIADTFSGLNL